MRYVEKGCFPVAKGLRYQTFHSDTVEVESSAHKDKDMGGDFRNLGRIISKAETAAGCCCCLFSPHDLAV